MLLLVGAAGMVDRKETLSGQSRWIDSSATEVATHVDRGYLIKSRCLAAVLSIARASAIKRATLPADVEIAIAVHIQCSVYRLVRNVDLRPPCDSGIGRTVEYPSVATSLVV